MLTKHNFRESINFINVYFYIFPECIASVYKSYKSLIRYLFIYINCVNVHESTLDNGKNNRRINVKHLKEILPR